MFDALRVAFDRFGGAFPGAATWSWQLAWSDAGTAVFLARTDALGPPGWVTVEVTAGSGGWAPTNMGQCEPTVVLSAELGPAIWALDPAYPAPTADTTQLYILVWELTCSSGSPTTGRMSAPVIDYTSTAVTITIGVRPLQVTPPMALTCPMPPGTPATVQLAEALGGRTLLDGGHIPPTSPTDPMHWPPSAAPAAS